MQSWVYIHAFGSFDLGCAPRGMAGPGVAASGLCGSGRLREAEAPTLGSGGAASPGRLDAWTPGRQAPQAGARFASLPESPRTSPA
ncbi:unnamed protein product [Rangifer tarandus platyrhynchus]|uniref:Uncharacterized protein n=1 Tax=Rangifer tarandus platyrhynchus TaxID=3082113 RepID=A0ABN8Z679_RANTA|nr:unnamed protein product [Rangifer tarandus platyrhynchus]